MDPQTFETLIYPALLSYRTEQSFPVPHLALSKMVVAAKEKSSSLLVLDQYLDILIRQTQPNQREELEATETDTENFPPSKGKRTFSPYFQK